MKHTAIIGGGAAGLMAACLLLRAGLKCTVLEKQQRVGRKLLSTGNGRCNMANMHASEKYYWGDKKYIQSALKAFSPKDAVAFFESIGVPSVCDEEGRVYPFGNQAAGVLDALRLYITENGGEIRCEFDAAKLTKTKWGWNTVSASGDSVKSDYVLIACGGAAAPKIGGGSGGYRLPEALGHKITPKVPAIAPLRTDAEAVRALKGIRAECVLTLTDRGQGLKSEKGEVLFNDGCVSGICAMQMARAVNRRMHKGGKCSLQINFAENMPEGFIKTRAKLLPERTMEDFLSGMLPKRLGQVLIKAAGVSPLSVKAKELTDAQMTAIEQKITCWELPVLGTMGFDQAQVTTGGAEIHSFDENTLESRLAEGVFAAGEVLDIDGDCGGFNLQWAWSSAYLCAQEIIRRS